MIRQLCALIVLFGVVSDAQVGINFGERGVSGVYGATPSEVGDLLRLGVPAAAAMATAAKALLAPAAAAAASVAIPVFTASAPAAAPVAATGIIAKVYGGAAMVIKGVVSIFSFIEDGV